MNIKRNILFVDADSIAHERGEKLLSSLGIVKNFYSALNGKEALNILKGFCERLLSIPELILLDLHMPVMNGFDFMVALNEMACVDKKKVTIVALTNSLDSREIAHIKSLGANYCLAKPITAECILSILAAPGKKTIL